MEIENNQLNNMLLKYKNKVDEISLYYNYPSNISHLLYLIVPGFVLKYGLKNESAIIKCFENVPIVINDNQDKIYQAYYFSKPKYENNNLKTIKGIVLNNYQNISLIDLLDNLVHEINHAVNSLNNEISEKNNCIYVRTGLSNIIYDKKTLQVIKKENESIIEEVINTKQTEDIINIISSFQQYEITDSQITNTIYSINRNANNNYTSNAYYLQGIVTSKLLENKTFIRTLEDLRFKGHIEEIDYWFDSITGKENSLKKLSENLLLSLNLELTLTKKKIFKGKLINRIRNLNQESLQIVETFNNNCNYR